MTGSWWRLMAVAAWVRQPQLGWAQTRASARRARSIRVGSGGFGLKVKVKGNGQECPFHTGVASLR